MADCRDVAGIDEERVAAAAELLRAGGHRYTLRQLYYAACRQAEIPRARTAPAAASIAALLVVTGLATGQWIVELVVAGIAVLLLLLAGLTFLQERRPLPTGRVLAMSWTEFAATYGAAGREGLITGPVPTGSATSADPVAAWAVTDRAEAAALLEANRAHLGAPVRVFVGLPEVRSPSPPPRVVALHDADGAGCALVADLRDAGLPVVDAGLRPREVMSPDVQLLEGAPAQLPRELGGHLDGDEIGWLGSGRRVELATLTPAEVIARVNEALGPSWAPGHPATPPET